MLIRSLTKVNIGKFLGISTYRQLNVGNSLEAIRSEEIMRLI